LSTDTDIAAARAELLRRRLQTRRTDTVPRRDDDVHPPLSFAQERLWFMDQLVPGTAAYTVPIATPTAWSRSARASPSSSSPSPRWA
jgi:hypothetical protein